MRAGSAATSDGWSRWFLVSSSMGELCSVRVRASLYWQRRVRTLGEMCPVFCVGKGLVVKRSKLGCLVGCKTVWSEVGRQILRDAGRFRFCGGVDRYFGRFRYMLMQGEGRWDQSGRGGVRYGVVCVVTGSDWGDVMYSSRNVVVK
ncbi:hypothetical protein Tco_0089252 [Tanacetum coccineum]